MYNDLETATQPRIRTHQLERLNTLLAALRNGPHLYGRKLTLPAGRIEWRTFEQLPFTTKSELVDDQLRQPPYGTLGTAPDGSYIAYHQTSGTRGSPMAVLDTPETWEWWSECWRYVYDAAGVTSADRVFLPFSFGPFIGFWAAFVAAQRLGALAIPGGGMDSKTRLALLQRCRATVIVCTPTYALHLGEVAAAEGINLRDSDVRVTIHAGEPGASVPSVRTRIEDLWGAKTFDHAGASEVGAFAYACDVRDGLHVNEAEFIAEVLEPGGSVRVMPGDVGELVLTNLGRTAWPVVRYRTGDLVKVGTGSCACGRTFLKLPGGIVGRADDLMIIRGINVYPSSIEAIVRRFDVQEFRIVRSLRNSMEEVAVEVECSEEVATSIATAFKEQLALRIPTTAVAPGSLPRFELKARRVVDKRHMV
jgi:phenylacetate-CoA ligase